jgi:gliding motility associated protien GldN
MKLKQLAPCLLIMASTALSPSLQAQSTVTSPKNNYTPWSPIKEKDIMWRKRVWRDVPVTDKKQTALITSTDDALSLTDVLMNEAKNGNITLYSAVNDRFTTKLSYADLTANINQLPLTRTVKDPFGSTYHECISAELLNKAIVKFKIKEDWLQTKDSKKVIVRILGIAPVVLITNTNGTTLEQPLFWAYYPDNRAILSQHTVPSQNLSWDSFFENRKFSSEITRMVE